MTGDPAGRQTLPAAVDELRRLAAGLRSESDPCERLLQRVAGHDERELLTGALLKLGAAALLDAERRA